MLPYKIRKPVYGGSNKPKTKDIAVNEIDTCAALPPLFGNDDEDPRIYGGNLQRAILSDLVDLRTRFHKQCQDSEELSRRQRRQKYSTANQQHGELGSVFSQFKAVFKRARFGAIHSRAVPSRIDRSEFAQLIYSSCFFLLREALTGNKTKIDKPSSDPDCEVSHYLKHEESPFMQDAMFAIFALYTLHKTNTLPTDPHAAKSVSTQYSNRTQEDLQQSWSFLPLGAANEGKLCRRYYKSPVRIDRQNYLAIIHLRDVCSAIVETCVYKMDKGESLCCNCSLAMDGMHVIDRMLHDDEFFSCCEYDGPCGLEGLAGNPVFYNAYYGNYAGSRGAKGSKRKRSGMLLSHESLECLSTSHILTTTKLNSMKPKHNDVSDFLDLSPLSYFLQQHMANLQSIQSELNASRQRQHRSHRQQPSNCDLKPRQQDLVEKTLSEVWICNDGTAAMPPYFDMLDFLTNVGKTLAEEHIREESSKLQQSIIDMTHQLQSAECATQVSDKTAANRINPCPLIFSPSLSSTLCNSIREALSDLHEMAESVRQSILKEREERIAKERKSDASNGSLAQTDKSAASGQDQECNGTSSFQDESASMVFDEVSVATGAGKKALRALLSISTHGHQRPPAEIDDFWNVQEQHMAEEMSITGDTSYILDDVEEISNSTDVGKKALPALLSLSGFGDGRPQQKNHRERSRKQETSKSKDLYLYAQESSEEDESSFSDSSTEAGRNALQFLLTRATASHAVPELRAQSKRSRQKVKKQPSSSAPLSSKRKAKSPQNHRESSLLEVDDMSVATGGGQKALAALLSNI